MGSFGCKLRIPRESNTREAMSLSGAMIYSLSRPREMCLHSGEWPLSPCLKPVGMSSAWQSILNSFLASPYNPQFVNSQCGSPLLRITPASTTLPSLPDMSSKSQKYTPFSSQFFSNYSFTIEKLISRLITEQHTPQMNGFSL